MTHNTNLFPILASIETDFYGQGGCQCGIQNENCYNIEIPKNDTAMGFDQQCILFARSSAFFQNVNCETLTHREQLNQATSYLDASQIYGSDWSASYWLRSFQNGQLSTSQGIYENRTYLPNLFRAGDHRVMENLGLTSIHTLFMREHNRIAMELSKLNPMWSDETLYLETRRIVQGIYQHIVFGEWVTAALGSDNQPAAKNTDYTNGYDNNVT